MPRIFAKDFTFTDRPDTSLPDYDNFSLEQIIKQKLEDYFQRTRGVQPENLYSLVIQRVERPLIELTLKAAKGNQIRAAKILGINRNTLRKKIVDLHVNIKKPDE